MTCAVSHPVIVIPGDVSGDWRPLKWVWETLRVISLLKVEISSNATNKRCDVNDIQDEMVAVKLDGYFEATYGVFLVFFLMGNPSHSLSTPSGLLFIAK